MFALYVYAQTWVSGRISNKLSDRGATAVEYGLMVALIAAAVVLVVGTLGGQLEQMFTGVSEELPALEGAAG